jgi:hypothetical protein
MYPADSRSHKSLWMEWCPLLSPRHLTIGLIPGPIWLNVRLIHNIQGSIHSLNLLKNLASHPQLSYNPHRRTRSA